MAYAFITEIKNVHRHSNADKLNIGECFGNQVIVSLETKENEIGVYFATDCQLGEEYAEYNNLVRKKDSDGNNIGGYLEPDKRNIRALKLRGEMSDGLFMPLKSLEKFTDVSTLKVGDCVDTLGGIVIAKKYIPKRNNREQNTNPKQKTVKIKTVDFPLFVEHVDTEQYAYNKHKFKEGDLVTITLKCHGTSARTSNTIRQEKVKQTFFNKLLIKLGLKQPIQTSYGIVTGTRRVVLDNFEDDKGYYGTNEFRKKYHDDLSNKLHKSESIFYEIVGFLENSASIMPTCDNKRMNDKEFIKQYGATTTFAYGCEPNQNRMLVYRMNMTNEDGDTVEYPTSLIKQRCEEMGLEFVPVLDQFFFTTIEDLEERVKKYTDGADLIDPRHIREGIVLRIENRTKFVALKNKSRDFKILEGIIKDAGVLDTEEAQEISE